LHPLRISAIFLSALFVLGYHTFSLLYSLLFRPLFWKIPTIYPYFFIDWSGILTVFIEIICAGCRIVH